MEFINTALASGADPIRECKIKIFSGTYTQRRLSTPRNSELGKNKQKQHEGYILT